MHSGENRVFRLNATFDFHKKSKVICSGWRPRSPERLPFSTANRSGVC
ncbi:hypothetical protein [Desulfovibrio sp. ZJ200]|nr:hypothetical protein [Desulfovibrio sp. ZJ200]